MRNNQSGGEQRSSEMVSRRHSESYMLVPLENQLNIATEVVEIVKENNQLLKYFEPPAFIESRQVLWYNSKLNDFDKYVITAQNLEIYNQALTYHNLQIKLYWKQNNNAQEKLLTSSAKFREITKISYGFIGSSLSANQFENLLKLSCQSYQKVTEVNAVILTIHFDQVWQFFSKEIIYRGGWGFNKFQGFGQCLTISKNQVSAQIGFFWQGNLIGFGIQFEQVQPNQQQVIQYLEQNIDFQNQNELQYNEYPFINPIDFIASKQGNKQILQQNILTEQPAQSYQLEFEDYTVTMNVNVNNVNNLNKRVQKIEGLQFLVLLKVNYVYDTSENQIHNFKRIDCENLLINNLQQ